MSSYFWRMLDAIRGVREGHLERSRLRLDALESRDVPSTSTQFFAVAAGAGGPGVVYVYDAVTHAEVFSFSPFGTGYTGGMTVAVGDLTGDGYDDIIVGAGAGGSPRVVVEDGQSESMLATFFAFDSSFRGGVNVASGFWDGAADVILGAGSGGGPQVRVIAGYSVTSSTQFQLASFFAYDPSFRGGVNVGAGNFFGSSSIIAGAGNGGGPQVEIYSVGLLSLGVTTPMASYFAYDSSYRGGVSVAAGQVFGDGVTDVITGTGPGGSPNVRVFSSTTTTQIASFSAYSASFTEGVDVGTVNPPDLAGMTAILTGPGPGESATVQVVGPTGIGVGASLQPYGPNLLDGVFVG